MTKVASVDTAESIINVTDAKGDHPRRVTLTPFTTITVNSKSGKLEDIKSGMKVYVSCASGNMATRIDAMDISPDEVDPSAETKK